MSKNNYIKKEKLTDHISYYISDSTIYLFQDEYNFNGEDIKIISKKVALIIENNDISYINITARNMAAKKDIYHDLGFILSYYDVNKLNFLFADKKDKRLYRCYGIMTKSDFFDRMKEANMVKKESNEKKNKTVSSNAGFASNMALLFGGIILLCYVCVQGAIYLVK